MFCLSRHGPTFRHLGISSALPSQQCLTMAALRIVITRCSHLDGFAVDFPVIDMGHKAIEKYGGMQHRGYRRDSEDEDAGRNG
jgi:hypothetical protein